MRIRGVRRNPPGRGRTKLSLVCALMRVPVFDDVKSKLSIPTEFALLAGDYGDGAVPGPQPGQDV